MRYVDKMRRNLIIELKECDEQDLVTLYRCAMNYDTRFMDCGLECYDLSEIISGYGIEHLVTFFNDISRYPCDHNPLYSGLFTVWMDEWEEFKPERLYDNISELVDYLVEQAGYAGFPGVELEWALCNISSDDIERYCKIIQDHS